MYWQPLLSSFLIHLVYAVNVSSSKYGEESNNPKALGYKNDMIFHKNSTYMDRAENMIRLPAINQADDSKNKKKFSKKSPKRTIQKIIKKNSQKTKRIFVIKMTSSSVKTPEDVKTRPDVLLQRKNSFTTSPPNQKKRLKKYNTKKTRYPMPFKNMQRMKIHKREKRDAGDDFYILKDFNELKFIGSPLDRSNDYVVANAHYKNYW